MAQTSIHFQAVKGGSEEHNKRTKKLDYVHHELSSMNEYWQSDSQEARLAFVTANAKAKTGRKMQAKATPIREAVVVIKDTTTMDDLHRLAERLQRRFGIEVFQIAIHKDEGYRKGKDDLKLNLHAHLVADWTDHQSGKSLKLNRNDMAEMQTICAEVLAMERGKSSEKQHLSAIQFKIAAEEQRAEGIQFNITQLTEKKIAMSDVIQNLNQERAKAMAEAEEAKARRRAAEKKAAKDLAVGTANKISNVFGFGKEAKALKEVPKQIEAAKAEGRNEAMLEFLKGAKLQLRNKNMSGITPEKIGQDFAGIVKKAETRAQDKVDEATRQLRSLKAQNDALTKKNKLFLSLPIIEAALEVLRSFVYHIFSSFSTEDKIVLSQVLQGDESRAKTLRDLGMAYGGVLSQDQYWNRWDEAEKEMRMIANGQSEEQGQTQGRGLGLRQ